MESVQKKVALSTLGCKLNFTETSTISRSISKNGYILTPFSTKADFYIINTCSVTENADKKFRSFLNKAKKLNPKAKNIVIGCYAQLKPEEISKIPGVHLVLGANEKFNIVNYLDTLEVASKPIIHSCNINEVNLYESSYSVDDRTRSFLKIQDGCDYKCSYCTIPLARGVSRSDNLINIFNNVKSISQNGVKEIVLTGVNIGDFGKGEFGDKKHKHTFLELIKALDQFDGINRFRVSSIEPNLLKNEIIDFISNSKKFVPHFHIPLQSGSNKILGLMRRRYQKELYRNKINSVKNKMKNACIGVDVIVGFPEETEDDFLETYNFLLNLNISYLHVFTYSERDNTKSSKMDNIVPIQVKARRSKMLRALSEKKKRIFYESQINKIKYVLFETENKSGYIYGFTENYIKVKIPWNPYLCNQIIKVKLIEIDEEGFMKVKIKEKIKETVELYSYSNW
ncbi:MAG: tRNA (N(6)-L-threonylcarbamoyladenosine(37)-C(2))-methylthiotransferase MtaB [Bacteroidetes bacterium MED-G13]|nr:MAG: tRNA (N(6)-L-threonylcarbamoyladenosine(37)-C(2))-methylthiotransferase MtaB [Bacteroidetes bacterium MED-G13]|tara:strand:- start:11798 stop:13162 length:1365 start_codon:yes stop_codon:yes gene_type:complete